MNLRLCGIEHIGEGLENDIKRQGRNRSKNNQYPAHDTSSEHMVAHAYKIRKGTSTFPAQGLEVA